MSDSLLVQVTVFVFVIMWATFGRVMARLARARQEQRIVSTETSDEMKLLEPTRASGTDVAGSRAREFSELPPSDDLFRHALLYGQVREEAASEMTDGEEGFVEPTHLVEELPVDEEKMNQHVLAARPRRRLPQDAPDPFRLRAVRSRNAGTRRSVSSRNVEAFRRAFKLMVLLAPPKSLDPRATSSPHEP